MFAAYFSVTLVGVVRACTQAQQHTQAMIFGWRPGGDDDRLLASAPRRKVSLPIGFCYKGRGGGGESGSR
jgi:hypothetical protein